METKHPGDWCEMQTGCVRACMAVCVIQLNGNLRCWYSCGTSLLIAPSHCVPPPSLLPATCTVCTEKGHGVWSQSARGSDLKGERGPGLTTAFQSCTPLCKPLTLTWQSPRRGRPDLFHSQSSTETTNQTLQRDLFSSNYKCLPLKISSADMETDSRLFKHETKSGGKSAVNRNCIIKLSSLCHGDSFLSMLEFSKWI